jgi:glycerol-3-phosphate dehydrogenase (NAD(P)+)
LEKRIGIIGNGSWSSALAKLLTDNQHTINWWMRSEKARLHLATYHHNPHYLSSVQYNPQLLNLYGDLLSCLQDSDIVLIGIPSAFIVDMLDSLPQDIFQGKQILSAIKGIIPDNTLLLNEYLAQRFHVPLSNYACISGPCHAEEVAADKLSYLTFAAQDIELAGEMAGYFENEKLHTVLSNDIYGVQYASVLKNIYALGAGIAHGLDYGDNFLSVFITNCFSELQQFMEVISQQNPHHYNTSAYLGDLLVTCYSLHSRNRTFGNFIGKGYSVNAAKLELNMVAEGYYASKGIHTISERVNYHLPIADGIYKILWEQQSAENIFKGIEMLCH